MNQTHPFTRPMFLYSKQSRQPKMLGSKCRRRSTASTRGSGDRHRRRSHDTCSSFEAPPRFLPGLITDPENDQFPYLNRRLTKGTFLKIRSKKNRERCWRYNECDHAMPFFTDTQLVGVLLPSTNAHSVVDVAHLDGNRRPYSSYTSIAWCCRSSET